VRFLSAAASLRPIGGVALCRSVQEGRDQRSKPLGASRIVKESPPVHAGGLFLANETKLKRRKGQPLEYR
jgi:hypothetical protein